MRRIVSLLGVFLAVISPLKNKNDAVPVWGGFGRSDNVFSCADTNEKIIALTFDDGPHPRYTDSILELLDRYGAKATFFVIGKNAESYPKILKKIYDRGHEIGNHTYSHVTAEKLSPELFKAELEKTHTLITNITGCEPTIFRPPTGHCNTVTVSSANEMRYKLIVWTVDTRDWSHESVQSIVSKVKSKARSGSIVLFHDFISHSSPTPEALGILLPYLIKEGYRFVTVSELLSYDMRS